VLDDEQGTTGENALALKHAFLKAYFTDGQDPSSHDTLVRYATDAGLDGEKAREVLASGRYTEEVREREQYYQQRGIHSVPAIIIDDKHLISGGQPPEVFEQALRQIAARDRLRPCGIFAGADPRADGLRPIMLERGKVVRERTKDTWGLWRKGKLDPGVERAVRRRRRRHVLRRQAVQPDQRPAPPRPQGADRVRQGRRAGRDPLRRAKPHIGTFRLVTMVEKMRADIEALGGEIASSSASTTSLIEGRCDDARCAA
jgi:hypothetical protein